MGIIKEDPNQSIANSYDIIHSMINKVSQYFDDRMSTHEDELLTVVKMQLHRAFEDLHEAVKNYNQAIKEKQTNDEIISLENERDFYHFEALKLFEENKALKQKIQELSKQNNDLLLGSSIQN